MSVQCSPASCSVAFVALSVFGYDAIHTSINISVWLQKKSISYGAGKVLKGAGVSDLLKCVEKKCSFVMNTYYVWGGEHTPSLVVSNLERCLCVADNSAIGHHVTLWSLCWFSLYNLYVKSTVAVIYVSTS